MAAPRRSLLVALLALAVAGGVAAWWLFAGASRERAPVASPSDDLDLVLTLYDGAAREPPHDVLVANEGVAYLARARDREVLAFPRAGGEPRLLATLAAPAAGMAYAAGTLWITTGHTLQRLSAAGGALQVVRTGLARPRAVVADAQWVFLVDVDASRPGLVPRSSVLRVPAAGGEPTVLGSADGDVDALALEGGNLYWADRLEGSIAVVPATGGAPRALAAERGLPGSLVAAAGALDWVEKRSESLWTMPAAGGAPRKLTEDFAGFARVVADARGAYWVNEEAVSGAFRVLHVGPGGGEVEPISEPVDAIDALATDGAHLYWDRDGQVSPLDAE